MAYFCSAFEFAFHQEAQEIFQDLTGSDAVCIGFDNDLTQSPKNAIIVTGTLATRSVCIKFKNSVPKPAHVGAAPRCPAGRQNTETNGDSK